MSKFRLDNPSGTSLDPFAYEKQFAQPNFNNPSPYSGVAKSLEVVAPDKVDEGYGTMGNSGYAVQAINEAKAANQGFWELTAKGIGNVAKTIGIEIAKTPGYVGGLVGAGINETFGDGKNSMSMIVDNAWVNGFESLDESIKEAMPVYISQSVQEGNLLDKLGSGEWWATAGADGLGFMLAMFAPGAAVKALGVGAKLAKVGEGLGKIAPRLGKTMTGAGIVEKAGETGFAYSKVFARNANGYASAVVNTAIESSAEAANTFDTVKDRFIAEGLSEEEASQKAGEAASAVFKGNMALLLVSNYLDERWLWKSIGSAGQKEAGKEMLSTIMKNGVVDMDAVKNIAKEFTRAKVLKRGALNFGKGVLKEGGFEEGSQTTLQQNIEKGKVATKGNVFEKALDDLYNVGASYFDDFANNTELHESIFLGGLLGGGASIIGSYQENMALKAAIAGGQARTKDNSIFARMGILPETKAQKGLANILSENHIKQFRTYKDLLDVDENGVQRLNEEKLIAANLEQTDVMKANILYDLSVMQGSKIGQELFGQYLAANYAKGFLNQEGGKELFEAHAKEQVLPAWQQRYLDTFGVEATSKQSQEYLRDFTNSGNRIFEAHRSAEATNYPERYFSEDSKDYADFKQEYFHNKFQTLVGLDSVKTRRESIANDLLEAGVTELELEDLSSITNPIKKQKAEEIKDDIEEIKEIEKGLTDQYTKYFTKVGVENMFKAFKARREQFNKAGEEILKENVELKEKVDNLPLTNQAELDRLQQVANDQGGGNVTFRGKDGKRYKLTDLTTLPGDLTELDLKYDDVSKEIYDEFVSSGSVPNNVLNNIVKDIINGTPLSDREQAIANGHTAKIEELLKAAANKPANTETNTSVEGIDPDTVDQSIYDEDKDKGVNMYPSTGRNLQDELREDKPGLWVEKMTDSPAQQLWFETLDKEVSKNPTAYTAQVVRLDDKSNPELALQIKRESDRESDPQPGDLYVVLYKDGKPVIKNGNYVFSSLWRPEHLYPVTKAGTPKEFILAKNAILENYLFHIKIAKLNLDKISKNQKEALKQAGIENPTEENLLTAAFLHAKQEYTEWYRNLQDNPGQLQVAGITKGHNVKMYTDKTRKTKVWGKPLSGIPGLRLTDKGLIGGQFQTSVSGTVKVGETLYKIPTGDVVIVDNENNVHPMKARNINEKEAQTVLYLLSLRSQEGTTESIKLSAPKPIEFGKTSEKSVPVFFNNKKGRTRASIINSLISFGSKDGGKGEIYFPQQDSGQSLLVWTDFDGKTQNVEVSVIKEAVDTGDFSKVESLMDFLMQKRFNINEHLLMGNSIFSKPQLEYEVDEKGIKHPKLKWNQDRQYFDHMLNDVLTTTTQSVDGYPNRVQRNLFFNRQPIVNEVESVVEETASVKLLRSTLSDLGIAIKSEENLASLGKILDDEKTFTTSVLQRRLSIGYQKASLLKDTIDKANGFVETVNTDFIKGKPPRDAEFILNNGTAGLKYRIFGINETVQVFNEGLWSKADSNLILGTARAQGYKLVEVTTETQAEKDASWERIRNKVSGDQTGVQERKSERAKLDQAYQEEVQKKKDHEKAQDAEMEKVMSDMKENLERVFKLSDEAFYGQAHIKMMGLTKITPKEVDNIIDVLYPGLRPGYVPLTTEEVEAIKKARSFDFVAKKVEKSFSGKLADTAMSVIDETPKVSAKQKVMDKIKNKKSLDSFKDDMDKILTTSDLLKQKIQSGEIIQKCK